VETAVSSNGGSLPRVYRPTGKQADFSLMNRAMPNRIGPHLLAKNTVFNLLGLGIPLLVGFFSIPVVIHWLGPERFGILSLVWVVVGYFSFFDLGLGRAVTKYIAEAFGRHETEKIPDIFWTTVCVQGAFGIFGGILLVILTPLLVERVLHVSTALQGETRACFLILAISVPIVMVSGAFRGALEASHRFDLVNIVRVPSSAFLYLAPLIGWLAGLDMRGIVVLLAGTRGLALVAWVFLLLREMPELKSRISFRPSVFRPVLRFGGWVMLSNLISPLLLYLDRFLIGSLLTLAAVGFYTAPYEVITRFGIIPASLVTALFPVFSTFQGEQNLERTKSFYRRSVRYLFLLLGPLVVLLAFFAGDFMRIWLGADLAKNCTAVFRILAVGFLMNSLAYVPFTMLQGQGRADLTAKFHLLESALYVPLAWLAISRWGIEGAAGAWTIRMTADAILLFLASRRMLGPDRESSARFAFARVFVIFCGVIAAGALAVVFLGRFPGLAVLLAGFAAAAWWAGLYGSERQWLIAQVRSVVQKPSTSRELP
jgi:O-antigen/teichoic acid export membrane protein